MGKRLHKTCIGEWRNLVESVHSFLLTTASGTENDVDTQEENQKKCLFEINTETQSQYITIASLFMQDIVQHKDARVKFTFPCQSQWHTKFAKLCSVSVCSPSFNYPHPVDRTFRLP